MGINEKTVFTVLEFSSLPCFPVTHSHTNSTLPQGQKTKWCPGPYLHSVNSNIAEMNFCASACSQISEEHWVQSDAFKNKTQESGGHKSSSISSHTIQITAFSLFSEGQELGRFVYNFRFCFLHHAAANYIIKTSKVKQSNYSEKAHGDHLLESFSDGSHRGHPAGQGRQHVPI